MVFRPAVCDQADADLDDKQLYLDDGMRKYAYWIVTNSTRSNTAVLRIAQGRGNQENLIKDFKHGLGLSHVPDFWRPTEHTF